MKKTVFLLLLFSTTIACAQNTIDWTRDYTLQIADFQSPATQIGGTNVIGLYAAAGIEFSFQMSNWEFLFTKNFNAKVSCTFDRAASSIVAPDSTRAASLLRYARFQFDLSELYARKFRKKLYEKKGLFSDVSFFRPIFDTIQRKFSERNTMAQKQTKMGTDTARLKALHEEVLKEIQKLPHYCSACKPPKKQKRRR